MSQPAAPAPGQATPPAPSAPAPTDPNGPAPDDDNVEPTKDPALAEARRESMKWKRQARDFQAQLDQLKTASQSEAERAIAAAKLEGAAEFKAKWARSQAENAALTILSRKGVVASELALRALDFSDVDVDEHGRVDQLALEQRIDELIGRYPMLSVNGSPGVAAVPTATGGNQHRVTENQLASIKDKEELNRQLRWALGGRG